MPASCAHQEQIDLLPHTPALSRGNSSATQNPESAFQTPRGQTLHRTLYISLGMCLATAVLIGAGFYYPKHLHKNSGNTVPSASSESKVEPAQQPASAGPTSSRSEAPPDNTAATTPLRTPAPKHSAPPSQVPTTARVAAAPTEAAPSQKAGPPHDSVIPGKVEAQPDSSSPPAQVSTVAPIHADTQLEDLSDQLIRLSSRAEAINDSLAKLRASQAAQGLELRSDVASSQFRMREYLSQAQSALGGQDAPRAKKYMQLAE
jgi:cytoskeletal protein RodZ